MWLAVIIAVVHAVFLLALIIRAALKEGIIPLVIIVLFSIINIYGAYENSAFGFGVYGALSMITAILVFLRERRDD